MKKIILFACAVVMASTSFAQVTVPTKNGDFNLRLIGRTNIDFGTNVAGDGKNAHDHYTNGAALTDTRLGISATFAENWYAKMELSYDKKALSFKDVYVGYKFNSKHALQIGNFWEPYSNKPMGTLNWRFIGDASIDILSVNSRRLGIGYMYTTDPVNITLGAFSDGSADAKALNQGYALAGKVVFRPILNEDDNKKIESVLHLGIAANYTNSPVEYTLSSSLPYAFESRGFGALTAFKATPKSIARYEGEFIYIKKKWYVEGHYLSNYFNLAGKDFFAQGASLQGSYLLIGNQQNYDKKTGWAKIPAPKSLELLARVDFLDMNFGKKVEKISFFSFGQSCDVTVGLNYYFNKYVNAKLNYIYGKSFVENDTVDEPRYHAIVGRLQFSF